MPSPDGCRDEAGASRSLDFLRGQQIFDDGRHLIDHRSVAGRFARKQADLVSDGLADLRAREPRKIVEQKRIGRRFLDLEFQVDRAALRRITVVDRGKYAERGEAIGGVLDLSRGDDVAWLQAAGGDDLVRGKFLAARDFDRGDCGAGDGIWRWAPARAPESATEKKDCTAANASRVRLTAALYYAICGSENRPQPV